MLRVFFAVATTEQTLTAVFDTVTLCLPLVMVAL